MLLGEKALIARLWPLVQRFATSDTWREARQYEVDLEQGYGVHLLHEESDHALAVFAISWLPGRGAPPHDHGVWAIVVGVDGPEKNVFWERTDDRSRPGYAELRKIGEKVFAAGEVMAMSTGMIHSVINESDRIGACRCTCMASTSTSPSARNSIRSSAPRNPSSSSSMSGRRRAGCKKQWTWTRAPLRLHLGGTRPTTAVPDDRPFGRKADTH